MRHASPPTARATGRARLAAALAAALTLLAAPAPARAGDPPAPAITAADRALFEWFDGLGFPDVRERPLVRIATGGWTGSGRGGRTPTYEHGFLVEERGPTFTAVGLDLETSVLTRAERSESGEPVGFEPVDLEEYVKGRLAALRAPPPDDPWERTRARFGERLSERAELFALARACERRLPSRAAELLAEARKVPDRQTGKPVADLKAALSRDLAYASIWRAVLRFGDPSAPRRSLLEAFEAFLRRYPGDEHAKEAAEYRDALARMVEEDAAHAAEERDRPPLAERSPEDQARELVFLLRDQNGHQWSQPGSCDVFADPRGEESPAARLVKLGHAAAPALIEALEDRTLTRSVGYWRDFTYSHYVLRVGDCALAALQRIAGRRFYVERTTSSAMVKDGEAATAKELALEWWNEARGKGERGALVDAVASGVTTQEQIGRLVKEWPADALDALVSGLAAAKDAWTRQALASALADLPGDAPVPALLAEARAAGAPLASRVAAADGLLSRGRPEGVAAMIEAWRAKTGAGDGAFDGTDDLVAFLARCGSRDAALALGLGLRERPVSLRLTVLEAFAPGSSVGFFMRGGGASKESEPRSPTVDAAIEDVLASALDDLEAREGMSGSWGDASFSDPRMCDVAAYVLARRAPGRYRFDWSAPEGERDRAVALARNAWREDRGLSALAVPAAATVTPVPAERVAAAVAAVRAAKDPAEREARAASLTALGLGALASLRGLAAEVPPDSPEGATLAACERAIACVVRAVEVTGTAAPGPALRARLDALPGAPLTVEGFTAILREAVRALPEGAMGVRLSAERAGDGTGFFVRLALLEKAVEDGGWSSDPAWGTSERVVADGESLHSSGGISAASHLLGPQGLRDLERALGKALASRAGAPVSARATLSWKPK